MSNRLNPTLRDQFAASARPLYGGWVCSGSPVMAEIMAGCGLDWLLVDMEHGPNGLESVLTQLQVMSAYPVGLAVRVPSADPVVIKQVLDIGAQNLIVPMVSTPDQARDVAKAVRYPPDGIRGVGAPMARSARWSRVNDYLAQASDHVSVIAQIETVEAVDNARGIAATDGIDAILVGPADLAASFGLIGQSSHPIVLEAVDKVFEAVRSAGKPVGVNSFDPAEAKRYAAAGASFVLVGADVLLLARASEQLAATFVSTDQTLTQQYG